MDKETAVAIATIFVNVVPYVLAVLVFVYLRKRRAKREAERIKNEGDIPLRPLGEIPEIPGFNGGSKRDYEKAFPTLADEFNDLREQFRERMLATGAPMQEIHLAWIPLAESYGQSLQSARTQMYRPALNGLKQAIEKAKMMVASLPEVPNQVAETEAVTVPATA